MKIDLIKDEDVRKIKIVTITKENPEYFWNNVDIKRKDECWIWKGYVYTHKNITQILEEWQYLTVKPHTLTEFHGY